MSRPGGPEHRDDASTRCIAAGPGKKQEPTDNERQLPNPREDADADLVKDLLSVGGVTSLGQQPSLQSAVGREHSHLAR
jgi:hypothetical protein